MNRTSTSTMQQTNDQNLFDSSNLFLFLWKKRKPILIISFIALAASAIFSSPFFIPEKFKSTVVMFPATNSSLAKSLLSENAGEKENIMQFGEEEEGEQMLQILNSDEIRNRVIAKYDLMKHYRINPNASFPITRLVKKFKENIHFNRTEYLAIEVSVLDENPDTAALIANDIANLLDSVKTRMQQERAGKALKVVEAEYLQFKKYIQDREDTLDKMRSLGVLDYESQVERLSEAYGKALMEGKQAVAQKLDEKLDILAKYGGKSMAIMQDMEHDREQLSKLKIKYDEAKIDAQEIIPHKFVVNAATPAEKKSYPVRWLIVVVSTGSAALLSIIVLLVLENIRRFKKSEIAD